MTLRKAKSLTIGTILYQVGVFNADGTPRRWRVNGKVKTWKRDPSRVSVPVKHGLYTYDYITEDVLDRVELTAVTALKMGKGK